MSYYDIDADGILGYHVEIPQNQKVYEIVADYNHKNVKHPTYFIASVSESIARSRLLSLLAGFRIYSVRELTREETAALCASERGTDIIESRDNSRPYSGPVLRCISVDCCGTEVSVASVYKDRSGKVWAAGYTSDDYGFMRLDVQRLLPLASPDDGRLLSDVAHSLEVSTSLVVTVPG